MKAFKRATGEAPLEITVTLTIKPKDSSNLTVTRTMYVHSSNRDTPKGIEISWRNDFPGMSSRQNDFVARPLARLSIRRSEQVRTAGYPIANCKDGSPKTPSRGFAAVLMPWSEVSYSATAL